MADTLEEKKRRLAELEAKLGIAPTAPAVEPSMDEKRARLMELEDSLGVPAEQRYAEPEPVPEPTMGEKAGYVASRVGTGLLETLDIPRAIEGGKEAVYENFPAVGRFFDENPIGQAMSAAGNINPFFQGMKQIDKALGGRPATEAVPGVSQAYDFLQEQRLTPEQLEANPLTKYAGVGAEWLGLPGGSAAARGIRGGADAVTEALPLLRRELTDAGIMSAGAGGGAAAGDYLVEEGGATGELVGGGTSAIAAAMRGKVPTLSRAQEDMIRSLQERLPPETMARVQAAVDAGEIGTLTDLTQLETVADVEAALARTSAGSRAMRQTGQARQEQISTETMDTLNRDIPEGTDPDTSVAAVRGYVDARETDIERAAGERLTQAAAAADAERAQVNAQAQAAQDSAEQAKAQADVAGVQAEAQRDLVDPGGRPDEFSTRLSENYAKAEEAHAADTRKLWEEFDNSANFQTGAYKFAVDDFTRSLDPAESEAFLEKYGKELDKILELPESASPRALSLRIQQMKDIVAKANKKNEAGWEEGQLTEVYKRLEEIMADPLYGNSKYAEAVSSTKQGYDQFGPGYVGDARRSAEPEELMQQLGLTGDRGAATARLINQSKVPELKQDVSDYVLAQARNADRTGGLNESFLVQYEAVLDNLDPSVRQQVQDLMGARGAEDVALKQAVEAEKGAARVSEQAAAEQARLAKALEAEEKTIKTEATGLKETNRASIAGEYSINADRADNVVDELLNRPDGAERLEVLLKDLLEADAAQGGTGAMESFQARLRDRMGKQLFEVFEPGADPKTLRVKPKAFEQFREMRRRLVDTAVMPAEDADKVDDLLSRMQTEVVRQQGRANIGDITSAGGENIDVASSALASAALGWLPGAYNLQMGGAARRRFKDILETRPTNANIKALSEYIADPAAFLDGVQKLESPAARTRFILSKFVGAGQAAEILAADEED